MQELSKSNLKAVVFDLDGTLLDTIDDITLSLNDMLSHFGYPTIDRDKTISIINHGAKSLVRNSFPQPISDEQFDVCFDYYLKSYANNTCDKTVLYKGVYDLLLDCKKAGYKVCVATNKQASKTLTLCGEKFNGFEFDYVLGVSDGVVPKPDPTAILSFLSCLGVKPQNAVMVGDGDTDVKTALNANMQSVAVLWGYRTKEQLLEAGAKTFASNAEELRKILLK